MIADIPSQISRRALYERRFSRPRSCGIYPASEAAASSEKTPLTNPSAAMANHDSICCSIINAKVRMLRMFTAPAITIIGFRGRLSDRVASGYAKAILGICMATAITPASPISPVLARIAMGRGEGIYSCTYQRANKGYVDSPGYFMCCHALLLPGRIKIAPKNCDEHNEPSSQKNGMP